jgi:hypothetical protein
MDLTERRATLAGIEGDLVGTAEDGWVWSAALPPERVLAFLHGSALGTSLRLESDGGVCQADVRRCWVDVGAGSLTLRVALEARPVA